MRAHVNICILLGASLLPSAAFAQPLVQVADMGGVAGIMANQGTMAAPGWTSSPRPAANQDVAPMQAPSQPSDFDGADLIDGD